MIKEDGFPCDWNVVDFEDVVDILDNRRKPVNSENRKDRIDGLDEDEKYPYYGAGGQIGWIDDYIFDDNLILVGEDGTVGNAYRVSGKTWVSNHAHVLKSKKDYVNQDFLYYYLKMYDFKPLITGAVQPKLNQRNLKKIRIPIPPLDEQERIVEAVEERLERVERLEKSVENVGRLADEYQDSYLAYLVTGGSESAVENLGHKLTSKDVPDDWTVKKVSEVVSAKNGGTPKRSEKKYWGGDIDWLSSGEIKEKYTNSAEENINKSAIKESSAKLFPKDSVLVAMYGSGTRGQSTIITDEMSGNQAICCLIPNDNVLSEYLLYFYKSIEDRLASKARGAAQRNLNQSMVTNEIIPVPPIDEQKEIIKNIDKYNFSRVENSTSLLSKYFDEYRDSILSHAFKGEIDY